MDTLTDDKAAPSLVNTIDGKDLRQGAEVAAPPHTNYHMLNSSGLPDLPLSARSPKQQRKIQEKAERHSQAASPEPSTVKDVPPPVVTASETPQRKFASKVDRDAAIVNELLLPGCLASIVSSPEIGHAGIKQAFDAIVTAAGAPSDPIEKMMVEQLILCHHRLAILHAQSVEAKSLEATKILNGAATRLQAEFRKSVLALRDYRLPPSRNSVAFIRQQNIAAEGGNQKVEYQDQTKQEHFLRQTKLSSPQEDLHELRDRVARDGQHGHLAEPAVAAVDA